MPMSSSDRLIRRNDAFDPLGVTAVTPTSPPADPARMASVLRARPGRTVETPSRRRMTRRADEIPRLDVGTDNGPGDTPRYDSDTIDELREIQRVAHDRGYAAGRAFADAELRGAIASAGALAAHLEDLAPRETRAVSSTVARLAMAVARRILGAEVRADPAVLTAALGSAVGAINGSADAHVLLHPAAVEPVRAAWVAAHGASYLGKRWSFEADPSLAPGACVLRYEHGSIDAGVEHQLDEIEAALEAAVLGDGDRHEEAAA
jgi:flagellar biosynthesis/type III secretory pathway protein FliH